MAYRVNTITASERKRAYEQLARELQLFSELVEGVAKEVPPHSPYALSYRLRCSMIGMQSLVSKLSSDSVVLDDEVDKTINLFFGALAATKFLIDHMKRCEQISEKTFLALYRHRDAMARILQENLRIESVSTIESGPQHLEVR